MNVDQIMKLVDEYAEERILATDEHSDGVDVALARASVVAALATLTKDAERYRWLRDEAYSYFWSDYAGLYPRTGLDKSIDATIATQKEQIK